MGRFEAGNEENWLNLTRELMEANRYAEAIATHEAIAANPKSYALQLRLGASQLAAGKYAESEASFRALVDAGDPFPTSYVGLAQALLREGRAEDAVLVSQSSPGEDRQAFPAELFSRLGVGSCWETAGSRRRFS